MFWVHGTLNDFKNVDKNVCSLKPILEDQKYSLHKYFDEGEFDVRHHSQTTSLQRTSGEVNMSGDPNTVYRRQVIRKWVTNSKGYPYSNKPADKQKTTFTKGLWIV